jgi:predicted nuclease with TOPRIM domain
MSLQISKIVLYNRLGELRELSFALGRLNIITGASKTGKSAIVDIVDYCTGRGECLVADGKIRDNVAWYGVLFQMGEGQIFVARRNPAVGEKTNPDVYLERGSSITLPALNDLVKNTTVDALEKFLGAAIGISENEHRPTGFTRPPLEANFRHALLFCIQDQNDIDSKQRLFHRQGEDFISTAIKDTLPYFLGAFDEEHLLKQSHLDQAKRELRILERQVRDSEVVDNNTFPRARALMDEAKGVGLIDDRTTTTTYEATLEALTRVATHSTLRDEMVIADENEILASLRAERQGLRNELEQVNAEIRSTRNFTTESNGYEREAKEQRARLSSVGLVHGDGPNTECPVCKSHLPQPMPTATQINQALQTLSLQLQTVEAENPRLLQRLASLEREAALIQERLQENQQRIATRVRENEMLKSQQDTYVLQARTLGKITQYIESVNTSEMSASLRTQVELARSRVAVLEQELDPEAVRERLDTFLNFIGRYMTDYSDRLDLEHRGSQLRLDIRSLTVIADTLSGPVPLFRMGSGENWVGYHVLAHLALHKWFRQKNRPVPGFLFLDQPSQAHYPPEKDAEGAIDALTNEDQTAVTELFQLMHDAALEIAPNLQVIVMDHADLKRDWFAQAVTERWRGNSKLIPESWYQGG